MKKLQHFEVSIEIPDFQDPYPTMVLNYDKNQEKIGWINNYVGCSREKWYNQFFVHNVNTRISKGQIPNFILCDFFHFYKTNLNSFKSN